MTGLPRSPQSIASSSGHRWTSPFPAVVASGKASASADAIVLNVAAQTITHRDKTVRLSRQPFLIFAAIACAGRRISISEIADFVWGEDADGGPEDIGNATRTQVSVIRAAMAPIGIGISSWHSWGYQVCAIENERRAGRRITAQVAA